MRVGILIPEFPGQTHSFFWREIQELAKLGIEPEIVSTRAPPPALVSHSWSRQAMTATHYLVPVGPAGAASVLRGGFEAVPAGWFRAVRSFARADGLSGAGRTRLAGLALVGAELAGWARHRRWAHVHAHSCADAAHVAMFASLLSGLSYSVSLHGPLEDYGPNQREKWRHAAFGLVITRRLEAEVRAALAGSLPATVEIAPMGVDLARFDRRRPYEPWTGRGPLRLFSCGRLNRCKGHADVITALRLLVDAGLDAHLTIAGEDEQGGTGYRRALERIVGQEGLASRITLLGAVSEERIVAGLEDAHLFVLASLAEPLGVAIMEAMAMEVPVVVTAAGGVPELVEDGRDGLLVPPGSPPAVADAVRTLANRPEEARALGARGRRTVAQGFHSGRSAEVLATLVRTVAADRGTRACAA